MFLEAPFVRMIRMRSASLKTDSLSWSSLSIEYHTKNEWPLENKLFAKNVLKVGHPVILAEIDPTCTMWVYALY